MSIPDMLSSEKYIGGRDISDETRYKFIDGIDEFLNMGQTHLFSGQIDAIEALRATGERGGGTIVMPTGSGKTEIFGEVIRATGLKTLIVTPTVKLVDQTLQRLKDRGHDSVRKVTSYDHESADIAVSITTYAGFVKRVGAPAWRYLIDPSLYEMVIYDEAHHLGTDATRTAMEHFSHAYQLGFTASPDYSDSRRLEEIMGTPLFEKGITEANREGLVSDFSSFVLSLGTDLSDIAMSRGDYERESLGRKLNTPERNAAVATLYQRTLLGKKTLFACANVAHSEGMATALQDIGVAAEAVHGSMPQSESDERIERFKSGETIVLTYARLLNEGFDEKSIEAIINVSPTASQILQQQRSGRAMRNNVEFVKRAVIIDCIDRNYPRRPVLIRDKVIYDRSDLITQSGDDSAANDLDEVLRVYEDDHGNRIISDNEIDTSLGGSRRKHARERSLFKQELKRENHEKLVDSLGLPSGNEDWWDDAVCATLGDSFDKVFFPEKGSTPPIAHFACSLCVVQGDCLDEALREPRQFGVKAGLAGSHRTQFLSRLRKAEDEPARALDDLFTQQQLNIDRAKKSYGGGGLGL